MSQKRTDDPVVEWMRFYGASAAAGSAGLLAAELGPAAAQLASQAPAAVESLEQFFFEKATDPQILESP
jgi:hypothetical protein